MIRTMQARDIAAAMRLKEAAGWNQTALDWERLLRLEPHGCFVDERLDVIVGSATALRHGRDLAWIGMVLVLPAYRRQGIARGLMQRCLQWLADEGVLVSRLDATDMGHPLYLQLGFRDETVVERWERPPTGAVCADRGRRPATALRNVDAALDLGACGYDRSKLIRDLAEDRSVEGVRSSLGFAFGRPGSGAWFLGPCIAQSDDAAGGLVNRLLRGHEGDRIFWDLLPSNRAAARLAHKQGFRRARRLARMVRREHGATLARARTEHVFAAAGFEFG